MIDKSLMIRHLIFVVRGFAETIDGLMTIFSLGFYYPSLAMRVIFWDAKRSLKAKIKERA